MRWMLMVGCVLSVGSMAMAIDRGPATITFVDGSQTRCEVLFEHPNAPRLVVRAINNSTLQSFAIAQVHLVDVGGGQDDDALGQASTLRGGA